MSDADIESRVDAIEAEVERLIDKQRHTNARLEGLREIATRNAEAKALITELLPLAERMARAAEVLMGGGPSEHQPLIDRATEWLRKMP